MKSVTKKVQKKLYASFFRNFFISRNRKPQTW